MKTLLRGISVILLNCFLLQFAYTQDYVTDSVVLAGFGINDISELKTDPDGLLYLNDPEGGLFRYTGNGFEALQYRDGDELKEARYLQQFLRDRTGLFYALRTDGSAVCFAENGTLQQVNGLEGQSFFKLLIDRHDRKWFLGERSWVLDQRELREVPPFALKDPDPDRYRSSDSSFVTIAGSSLLVFDLLNEEVVPYPLTDALRDYSSGFVELSPESFLFLSPSLPGSAPVLSLFNTRNGQAEQIFPGGSVNWRNIFPGRNPGTFLISSGSGLYRINPEEGFEPELLDSRLPEMKQVLCDRYGNIWCSNGSALYRMTIRRFYHYPLQVPEYLYPWNFSRKGLIDKHGAVWFAGAQRKISYFDPFTGESMTTTFPEGFPYRASQFRGAPVYMANFGTEDTVFWFKEPPVIRDLASGGAGQLYIAGWKTLYYCNPDDSYFVDIFTAGPAEDLVRILPLHPDSLILFTNKRVLMIDRFDRIVWENGSFAESYSGKDLFRYNFDNEVLSAVRTGDALYIRTINALIHIRLTDGRILTVYPLSGRYGISEYFRGNLVTGPEGRIWFSAGDTLYAMQNDKVEKKFNLPSQDDGKPALMQELLWSAGRLWINTSRNLLVFDPETEKIAEVYRDKLMDVYALIDGTGDFLWRLNTRTVQLVNKKEGTLISFPVKAGANRLDVLAARTGSHIIATNGQEIVRFDERSFLDNPVTPAVLTRLAVNREPVCREELSNTDSVLIFKAGAERITFRLATGDPGIAASASFMYRMTGFDPDWMIAGRSGEVNYTSLPAGSYTFEFVTQNKDGIWGMPSKIRLKVLPPWWETKLAIVLYVVFTTLFVTLIIRFREKKLKEDKRRLEAAVKERTAEIEKQKEEIACQRDLISAQKKDLTDSINYASRIQTALIPGKELVTSLVPDNFILYRPRDIVSGDFYWASKKGEQVIMVAADCTGHGVPGSLLSMLGITFLEDIVQIEGITSPGKILDRLRERMIKALRQSGKDTVMKDGMDIVVVSISLDVKAVHFAGAKNPLYLVRQDQLLEIKGDSFPVAISDRMLPFSEHRFELGKGDLIYLFSDGFADQFGGQKEKKFKYKRFRDLLYSLKDLPMSEQRALVEKAFDEWKGEIEQIDDVLVIGIRL
ncbi:MAG: SpoIIE family protein phosphatase [Bacteroidota bacterium]